MSAPRMIPKGCRPSEVAASPELDPLLSCGRLVAREDGMWLCATDRYSMCAILVDADVQEGFVPLPALKRLEQGGNLAQTGDRTWTETAGGTAVTWVAVSDGKWPTGEKLESLGLWDDSSSDKGGPVVFGAKLFAGLVAALGGGVVRVCFSGPLGTVRVRSQNVRAVGLLMPIRPRPEESS